MIFVSQRCTLDLITKILSSVFFFTLFAIKYNMFSVKAVKDLLEQLLHIYNELKDENEIAIIDKYGYNGKRYTVVLTILAVINILAFIIASFWSNILNVILPTNASRSHHLLIMTEHLIDQEKYFYLILLHTIASFCIGMIALLATGTMILTYLLHICGMFKIASYRIECAMSIDMLQNINLKKNLLILNGLIYAVDIHRQAMKFIFQLASSKDELILPFVYAIVAILYMFLANYMGQILTNHNHHVFVTVYNVRWYITPLYIQRIILFLLQQNSRNFTLNVGGLFYASIECFAMLVNTSVSYFTVLYSTR
ncbi:hypothetical protein ACFW04_006542 [Cataglyphis niger]